MKKYKNKEIQKSNTKKKKDTFEDEIIHKDGSRGHSKDTGKSLS